MIQKLTKENFKKELSKTYGLSLVFFYSDECTPCQAFKKVFKSVSASHSNKASFFMINIDTASYYASRYRVEATPTTVMFYNKKAIGIIDGYVSRTRLAETINEYKDG